MATPEAIRDEQRRVRRVQAIAQVTTSLLMQARMSRTDGEALVAYARARILELFPGRDETYEYPLRPALSAARRRVHRRRPVPGPGRRHSFPVVAAEHHDLMSRPPVTP